MVSASYSPALVLISLCVAILASYTALDLAGRIATARGRAVFLWMGGGSLAMGFGIWSMHFIGMLALSLPIELGYDVGLTLWSLLVAILSSGFALWMVSQPRLPALQLLFGALIMGAGISAMHYSGMAALRMQPGIDYDPALFGLSLVIAVGASAAALSIAFRLRQQTPYVRLARAGASVIMGLAIVGMHYTGMAAASFPAGSFCGAALDGLSGKGLDNLVLVASLAVLIIALLTSIFDARLDARTAALADSLTLANQELTQLALHDNLTGLPNRVLLADRIGQAQRKVAEQGGCFSLMFIDLDGFKPVNDAFGHHLGDRLLREVALRLREQLRGQDTLARIGGDEFVLLVRLNETDDAPQVAARQVVDLQAVQGVAGEGQPDHRERVGLHLGDDRLVDRLRQPVTHARGSVTNLGRRRIGVLLQAEAHRDLRLFGTADGGDHVHRIDAGDGVFQRLGDLRLHDLGRCARVLHADGDDRFVDLRVLADRQLGKAHHPDQQDQQRQHRRKDGAANGNFRELHGIT